MDKNFINVDDLVRQKLEGREEREPSGAWLNMQELLNKEMPQAGPVGSLLWRRVFSTMAVMLVVGAAGVGGYKLVSGTDGANKQAATKIPVSTMVAENAVRNSAAGKQIAASGTGESVSTSSQPVNGGMDNNAATQHEQGLQHTSVSGMDSHVGNSSSTGTERAGDKTATTNNTGVSPNNTTADNKPVANNNGNSRAGVVAKSANNGETGAVAATVNRIGNANRTGATPAKNTSGNGRNDAMAAMDTRSANTHNTTGNVAVNTIANDHASKVSGTSKNDKRNVVADRVVAGGTKTSANGIATVNTDKLLNNQPGKDARKNNNVPASVGNTRTSTERAAAAKTTGYEPGIPVFVTQSGKSIPGDKLQKLNRIKARMPLTEIDPTAVTQTAKKTIQKMSLVEHFIKTTPGEGFYKLDTVSNVTLTEELGIITETRIIPAAKAGHVDSPARNKAMNQTKLK